MAASQLVSPPKASVGVVVSVAADIGCKTLAVLANVMTAPCACTPLELRLLNRLLAPLSAPWTWLVAPCSAMLPETSTTKITLMPQLGAMCGGGSCGRKGSLV